MERTPLKAKINILTEDTAGNLYLLEANDFNEIVNDWNGDRCFVPEADAKVYFATCDGKPVSPYVYKDFMSLMGYIRVRI